MRTGRARRGARRRRTRPAHPGGRGGSALCGSTRRARRSRPAGARTRRCGGRRARPAGRRPGRPSSPSCVADLAQGEAEELGVLRRRHPGHHEGVEAGRAGQQPTGRDHLGGHRFEPVEHVVDPGTRRSARRGSWWCRASSTVRGRPRRRSRCEGCSTASTAGRRPGARPHPRVSGPRRPMVRSPSTCSSFISTSISSGKSSWRLAATERSASHVAGCVGEAPHGRDVLEPGPLVLADDPGQRRELVASGGTRGDGASVEIGVGLRLGRAEPQPALLDRAPQEPGHLGHLLGRRLVGHAAVAHDEGAQRGVAHEEADVGGRRGRRASRASHRTSTTRS